MSKSTFFRRIALGLIASVGVGLLSVPTASAVRLQTSLTVASATASATVGDSATGSWTLRATATSNNESYTVRYTCSAPAGVTSCPALLATQSQTSDTANNGGTNAVRVGVWTDISSSGWSDTASTANLEMRSTVSYKITEIARAGTYVYLSMLRLGLTAFTTEPWNWLLTQSLRVLLLQELRTRLGL